jgi:hypothetical protein
MKNNTQTQTKANNVMLSKRVEVCFITKEDKETMTKVNTELNNVALRNPTKIGLNHSNLVKLFIGDFVVEYVDFLKNIKTNDERLFDETQKKETLKQEIKRLTEENNKLKGL